MGVSNLFGLLGPRKRSPFEKEFSGLFDVGGAYPTPGIGDGVGAGPGMSTGGIYDPEDVGGFQARAAGKDTVKDSQRWMDGGKFTTRDGLGLALGAIGDAFSRQNGGEAVVAPMIFKGMSAAREAKAAAAKAAVARQAEREDFLWRQQNTPYRWEANDGSQMERGADGTVRPLYKDPTPKYNFVPDGMGGGRYVPLPGTGSGAMGGGEPPPAAIEALRANPQLQGQFEAKYGSGSAARYLGGGAGNGAGTFRYR